MDTYSSKYGVLPGTPIVVRPSGILEPRHPCELRFRPPCMPSIVAMTSLTPLTDDPQRGFG